MMPSRLTADRKIQVASIFYPSHAAHSGQASCERRITRLNASVSNGLLRCAPAAACACACGIANNIGMRTHRSWKLRTHCPAPTCRQAAVPAQAAWGTLDSVTLQSLGCRIIVDSNESTSYKGTSTFGAILWAW
ncbi:uncharacterized protein LOC142576679 [Dermacentor variabilis]|uniref:uncharacterized protein LOC142576679 n=1 Tax=Dermacentor variabilis TaxID=34621 RepID=UPI003F5BCDB8